MLVGLVVEKGFVLNEAVELLLLLLVPLAALLMFSDADVVDTIRPVMKG